MPQNLPNKIPWRTQQQKKRAAATRNLFLIHWNWTFVCVWCGVNYWFVVLSACAVNKWIECCVSEGICKVLPTWANNRHNVAGERAIEVDQCVLVLNGFRFLKTHKKRSQKQSSPVQSIPNTNLPIISAHDALMHTHAHQKRVDTHPYANRNYLIPKPCQLAAATWQMPFQLISPLFSHLPIGPTCIVRPYTGLLLLVLYWRFIWYRKAYQIDQIAAERDGEKKVIYCFNLTVV